jgi:hypothetical protein
MGPTDGVYTLANGDQVFCNMTLDGGGWMLIANVPPAPPGFWEHNAQTYAGSTPLTDLGTTGMLLPATVDGLGVPYAEVLFTDTFKNNWFTVAKTSNFYLHNYNGSCNDANDVNNSLFSVTGRSSGAGELDALWANGCPNTSDYVASQNPANCGSAFVLFDQSCSPLPTGSARVRAYVR